MRQDKSFEVTIIENNKITLIKGGDYMDFLFEIGLEELPSRYVDETEANLKKIMTEKLTDERISFSDIESFSTPRRVAVFQQYPSQ